MVRTRHLGLLILFLAAGCAGKERAPELAPPWAVAQDNPATPATQPAAVKAVPEPAPRPAAVVPEPVAVQPAPRPAVPPATVAAAPVAVQPDLPAAPPAAVKPDAPVVKPETPVTKPEAPVVKPETPVTKPEAPVVKPETPVTKPEAPVVKPEAPVAKPAAPVVKPAVKAPAPPAPKKEAVAPTPPKPAAATLDLASLEKRLKETNAIGVFTKLTLKNQVDDLVNQFRAYYGGQAKTTLAALRQPYDQLVIKVLALLQDGDPSLARAIVESREAIWGILSDPEKFKKL